MGKLTILVLMLLTAACAPYRPPTTVYRDERLASYLGQLEEYYGQSYPISASIAVLANSHDAYCDTRTKTIVVSQRFYDEANKEELEEVILHEFGHCAFNKGHYGVILMGGAMHGCMTSVMHPSFPVSSTACWTKFKNYYRDEVRQ